MQIKSLLPLVIIAIIAALFSGKSEVTGFALVNDADTITIMEDRIRFKCVDAIELGQQCQNGREQTYPCGQQSKLALQKYVAGKIVHCEGRFRDKHGRMLGWCDVENKSLNEWVVEQGWALGTCPETSPLEASAKSSKRGIWQGAFTDPRAWRGEHPRDP